MKPWGLPILLALTALANAQSSSIPSMMSSSFRGQSDPKGNTWGTLTMTGRTLILPALLGAPFSGEESRKSEQLLADGTRITRPAGMQAKVARDAQGRTRVERPLMQVVMVGPGPAREPLVIVEINDPVEGYYYVIDPANRIAYRVKYKPIPPRTIPPQAPAQTKAGPIQIKGGIIPGGNPATTPQITAEQIGSKFIQGVEVLGQRTTTVIPVGARGNDRPITEVTETWRAPTLQVMMEQTTKSPMGDNTFELMNFSAVNPTPDLFRPPPGYEVRDQPSTFTVEFGKPPAGVTAAPGTPH
jgi:hypothetical protein